MNRLVSQTNRACLNARLDSRIRWIRDCKQIRCASTKTKSNDFKPKQGMEIDFSSAPNIVEKPFSREKRETTATNNQQKRQMNEIFLGLFETGKVKEGGKIEEAKEAPTEATPVLKPIDPSELPQKAEIKYTPINPEDEFRAHTKRDYVPPIKIDNVRTNIGYSTIKTDLFQATRFDPPKEASLQDGSEPLRRGQAQDQEAPKFMDNTSQPFNPKQKKKKEEKGPAATGLAAVTDNKSVSTALTFETGKGLRANMTPTVPIQLKNGTVLFPRILTYGDQRYEERKMKVLEANHPKDVYIESICNLRQLAEAAGLQSSDLAKTIIKLDEPMENTVDPLDLDLISIVLSEYNMRPVIRDNAAVEVPRVQSTDAKDFVNRPPVVAIMGHINHGKTSLLDSLRRSRLTEEEAGGITQGIAGFNVTLESGAVITFVDTPGHEAFSKMRSRGAKIVDITVIVVAGDEGVKEQTIEAISHVVDSKCPVIVAINKKDKNNYDSTRVKNQLLQHSIIPVDYGGDVHCVEISAKKKEGLEELEDAILLVAADLDLKASPSATAEGTVIEARLDRGRGPMGTVLLQHGQIKVGQSFVSGITYGKIKAMHNDKNSTVDQVGPSTPVSIMGAKTVMTQGDDFLVVGDERRAKEVVGHRNLRKVQQATRLQRQKDLEEEARKQAEDAGEELPVELPKLNLILKAGSGGSLEALEDGLAHIPQDKVQIRIIKKAVGNVNEGDLRLAELSNATLVAFNSTISTSMQQNVREKELSVVTSKLIYSVFEKVREKMVDCLEPTITYTVLGEAKVQQVFQVGKRTSKSSIAGCLIMNGTVSRKLPIRVMRGEDIVYHGRIDSLRHHKDSIAEVKPGMECGMSIHDFGELQEGDIIQAYTTREVRPKLVAEWLRRQTANLLPSEERRLIVTLTFDVEGEIQVEQLTQATSG
ncbi:translation initiation factor IF-2 [Planoprotostelium fungivorum]|uniref:Translation initiation factor IF-2, chloroplastic n=1 Tax=Planoprotostelium fungivorum TaxID=1890364 RepID=A0A2P6NY95_9EUKA|nr:translation initiation factor IF-2 [Planoprotostelium fungivorum]